MPEPSDRAFKMPLQRKSRYVLARNAIDTRFRGLELLNDYGKVTTVICQDKIMEGEVSKSKFKAHALEIFRRVEATGEPVIVTDHGQPTLIVQKYKKTAASPNDKLKGSVLRYDAPFAPVDEGSWEALA